MAVHWEEVERLAKAHRLVNPSVSEEDLTRSLRIWWCIKYSRPFKDPLLLEYSLDELIYEYLTHHFMNPDFDPKKKIEEKKAAEDDQEWVRKMMSEMSSPQTEAKPQEEFKKEANEQVEPVKSDLPLNLPELSTTFDE